MKVFVSVIGDDGNIIYMNKLLEPVREEVIVNPYEPPMKESRFSFCVKQQADFQTLEVEDADSN